MDSKNIARIALGTMFIATGLGHLTFARKTFRAQVPDWTPISKNKTVEYSGYAELGLAAAVLATPKKYRKTVGYGVAAFLVAVFPGNYAQYKDRKDGFGLNTDSRRFARLFMQIPLIIWALKAMDDK